MKKEWRRQIGNDQEVKSLALTLMGHMREWEGQGPGCPASLSCPQRGTQGEVEQDTLMIWFGIPEPYSRAFVEQASWRQKGVMAHSYNKAKGMCKTKEGMEEEGKKAQDKSGGQPSMRLRQQQGIQKQDRKSSQGAANKVCSEV